MAPLAEKPDDVQGPIPDSSQLDGNWAVWIGTLSVWPSIRVRSGQPLLKQRPLSPAAHEPPGNRSALPGAKASESAMLRTTPRWSCVTTIFGARPVFCLDTFEGLHRVVQLACHLHIEGDITAVRGSGQIVPLKCGILGSGQRTRGFTASINDWAAILSFPSLTAETEYITTKNANRSVMKSA